MTEPKGSSSEPVTETKGGSKRARVEALDLEELEAFTQRARVLASQLHSADPAALSALGSACTALAIACAQSLEQSQLLRLPPELLVRCFEHCDARALASLERCCHSLHDGGLIEQALPAAALAVCPAGARFLPATPRPAAGLRCLEDARRVVATLGEGPDAPVDNACRALKAVMDGPILMGAGGSQEGLIRQLGLRPTLSGDSHVVEMLCAVSCECSRVYGPHLSEPLIEVLDYVLVEMTADGLSVFASLLILAELHMSDGDTLALVANLVYIRADRVVDAMARLPQPDCSSQFWKPLAQVLIRCLREQQQQLPRAMSSISAGGDVGEATNCVRRLHALTHILHVDAFRTSEHAEWEQALKVAGAPAVARAVELELEEQSWIRSSSWIRIELELDPDLMAKLKQISVYVRRYRNWVTPVTCMHEHPLVKSELSDTYSWGDKWCAVSLFLSQSSAPASRLPRTADEPQDRLSSFSRTAMPASQFARSRSSTTAQWRAAISTLAATATSSFSQRRTRSAPRRPGLEVALRRSSRTPRAWRRRRLPRLRGRTR